MFGSEGRAGRKAFDECDVKRVEFKTFVWEVDEENKPTHRRVLSGDPSEDTRTSAGHGAVLHCPRTEDDKVFVQSESNTHYSRNEALRSVRKAAGNLLCRDCQFATMTPVQVSIERTELANAERARIEAYHALDEARAELEAAARPIPLPAVENPASEQV